MADLYKADLRGAQMSTAEFMGANLHEAQLAGADMRLACLAGSTLISAGLQGVDLGGAYLQGADLGGAMLHGANLKGAKLQAVRFGLTVLDGANLSGSDLGLTIGIPASLYLTILDDVKYRAGETIADYRNGTLCPSDLWTLEGASSSGSTIAQRIERWQELAVKKKWRGWDWREIWNTRNHTPLGRNASDEGGRYWQDLRDWTVDFACTNQFTALSTLRRWEYTNKIDNLSVPSSVWRSVRKDLASKRRSEHECPGLASLPGRLWESFMLDWN